MWSVHCFSYTSSLVLYMYTLFQHCAVTAGFWCHSTALLCSVVWLLSPGATLLFYIAATVQCVSPLFYWCDSWVPGQLCYSIMQPLFDVLVHCTIGVTLGFWGHYPTNEGEQLMCFQSWISISYLAFIPLSLLITISSICSTFTHRVLWVSIANDTSGSKL